MFNENKILYFSMIKTPRQKSRKLDKSPALWQTLKDYRDNADTVLTHRNKTNITSTELAKYMRNKYKRNTDVGLIRNPYNAVGTSIRDSDDFNRPSNTLTGVRDTPYYDAIKDKYKGNPMLIVDPEVYEHNPTYVGYQLGHESAKKNEVLNAITTGLSSNLAKALGSAVNVGTSVNYAVNSEKPYARVLKNVGFAASILPSVVKIIKEQRAWSKGNSAIKALGGTPDKDVKRNIFGNVLKDEAGMIGNALFSSYVMPKIVRTLIQRKHEKSQK